MRLKKLLFIFIFLVVIIIFGFSINFFINKKVQDDIQVPVLMYHYIAQSKSSVDYEFDSFIISLQEFEKQMKYLYDNHYDVISIDELLCWMDGDCNISKKSVVLTFDDGFTSTYYVAAPILNKYNFNSTMFVINSKADDDTISYNVANYAYVGYDMIDNYDRNVVDIGSHSYDMHSLVDNKSKVLSSNYNDLYNDFSSSKKLLNCKYLSYPYGAYSNDAIKAAKNAGYKAAFTVNSKKTFRNENKFKISRIGVVENHQYFIDIFETDKHDNN